jgi:hypothetical protein
MTEQEKKLLADGAGWSEDKRVDDIKLGIRTSEYDKDKENAIHRKTLKIIIDKLIKGERLTYEDVSEFIKYNDDIETIKAEVDGK